MFVQDEYWSTRQCGNAAARPEGYADGDDDTDADGADPPYPVRHKTLIIWYRKECAACQFNEPLFRRLEKNSSGFRVMRVQASDRRLQTARYKGCVLVVPQYDLVWYGSGGGGTVAYGPGTTVLSVPNTDRAALARHFPEADVLNAR